METREKTRQKMLREPASSLPLAELGAVRVRGPDTVRFLQGQLSQNIERLSAARSLLAGLHNAQGRVIALLRLLRLADNDVLAILPRELAAGVAARLAKFVLRAKVTVSDESSAWAIAGVIDEGTSPAAWPRKRDAQSECTHGHIVCVGEAPVRWIRVAAAAAQLPRQAAPEASSAWHRHEIASGEPQVFGATSEAFVSQMLNLDLLDAIAFDKGCYTGQEIIARAHYRGRMKRRLQRFRARTAEELSPGARGRLADGRSFTIVRAERSGEAVDFLAVASLAGAEAEALHAGAEDELLHAESLPLPYALPD